MFKKILIANRGEIACRIIKTARRMGIQCVAVYSDADIDSLHVRMADEAVRIGPAASAESYLDIDAILAAIAQTGAEAVHPGFGFLSENAEFASRLESAGVRFIGPGTHAIDVMGDKIRSKKLAEEAGVSTVPGFPDAMDSPEQAHQVAAELGCPVMLKASAGGGGKGMRVAWKLEDVQDLFTSAANEARSAFGDDRVFVEKFIEQPRHIEIQVLADQHGNSIYLGERECSIQRRHQKVLEEAPSPFLDEATRQAMGQQAVSLARAVDYCSAGTVEFIVDKERQFYFLEMNTRLQVEHPVTEFITGVDLVEQMIRVAAGESLQLSQADIKLNGWSLEARVYAEDPDRNFMPSTGRVSRYQPPLESDSVRVDTGIHEGGEISMFYDPMIAKLVTYGADRESARTAMLDALDQYTIRGVKHNIPFLAALVDHPAFTAGDLTTAFIDDHYPDGFDSSHVSDANRTFASIIASCAFSADAARARQVSGQMQTHLQTRLPELPAPEELALFVGDSEISAVVSQRASGSETTWTVSLPDAGEHELVTDWRPGKVLMDGTLDGDAFSAQLDRTSRGWQVTRRGQVVDVMVLPAHIAPLQRLMPDKPAPDMSRYLLSPMPGLLIRLAVSAGERVKPGQELAVVEAMKMENVLCAEREGIVREIMHEPGASLAVDEIIMEFDAEAAS